MSFWFKEITLSVTDSEKATTTATVDIVALPENDPPVFASRASTYNSSVLTHDGLSDVIIDVDMLIVREDEDSLIPGLSLRDVDLSLDKGYVFGGDPGSADGGIIEISVYTSNGTISLGPGTAGYIFLVGDGVDDRSVVFRTSLAGANQALAGLMYCGLNDFYGTDELIITVDDLGNYGRGPLCSDGDFEGWAAYVESPVCPQVSQLRVVTLCFYLSYRWSISGFPSSAQAYLPYIGLQQRQMLLSKCCV